MYADSTEPSWGDFKAEYSRELQDWRAPCSHALPHDGLEHAVRFRGAAKVGGTDGWATAEGRHPLSGHGKNALKQLLKDLSPLPLLFGTVSLLPKTDTGLPDDQRPLTCLSLWNVGWDKAIYNLTKPWLDQLLPVEMRGARPGGMTMDVAWVVTLLLEHAHCFSQNKAGYLLDREKCFDRLPWSITFALEQHAGFPQD